MARLKAVEDVGASSFELSWALIRIFDLMISSWTRCEATHLGPFFYVLAPSMRTLLHVSYGPQTDSRLDIGFGAKCILQ